MFTVAAVESRLLRVARDRHGHGHESDALATGILNSELGAARLIRVTVAARCPSRRLGHGYPSPLLTRGVLSRPFSARLNLKLFWLSLDQVVIR